MWLTVVGVLREFEAHIPGMPTVKQYAIAGGVGVANIAADILDESKGLTEPFKRAKDYVRIGALGLGIALKYWLAYEEEGDALILSSIPLVADTIKDLVKKMIR